MSTLLSMAQINKVKNAGKEVMSIMTEECKSIYTAGMSENDFINAVYGTEISKEKRTLEGIGFFKQVHSYLANKTTSETIKTTETGDATLVLIKKALVSSNIEEVIFDNGEMPIMTASKWKIIELLLKLLKEILEELFED